MSLDFQQVREQVKQLGERAPRRAQELEEKRQTAHRQLESQAGELARLRRKVQMVASQWDATLRCALPVSEPLNACFSSPAMPPEATILAADGSQIAPDRHAPVDYCLINVGSICMQHGLPEPPSARVVSRLYYDEEMYTPAGTITDARLALMRDLEERSLLADLAATARPPVITLTDGPMELWGAKDSDGASDFQKSLEAYQQALHRLCDLQAVTAGYVDKPAANLVVRLLEVSLLDEQALPQIKNTFPLRGVSDIQLFHSLLGPGERSAVFAMQSKSAALYKGRLALHFFYLNVGRLGHPSLSRVEIPAWVAENPAMLEALHAALVSQCRIMGTRPFPYVLHRAHETAVVPLHEKEQVTQMIMLELRRRGVGVGEGSNKQSAKDLPGRTAYKG